MNLKSIYSILSIIKTSETNPDKTLQEEENSIKNGHLKSTNSLVPSSENDQSEIKPPISPVLIFPPSPVNFEKELVKLKGFAKFIDPSGNKLLNLDDFKAEFEKIKNLNGHIKPNESQICNHKEIKNELTRLQKFIKFINSDNSEPINPSIVENEIEKLIEIGKFVNPDKPLCIRSNIVKQFLDKLENLLAIFDQSEGKILNFKSVFDIFERATELFNIFDLEDKRNFNFNDNNPLFDLFKKFTKEKNDFCLKVSNTENFEENLQVELTKFVDENVIKQPENSFDSKQTLEKLKNLANFLKLCDIKTLNTEEYEKILNKELNRLKKISQFMDPNNAKSFNIDSFGQELEKYMKFAELIDKSDLLILNYKKVVCELSRLEEFSEIINLDGSKSLEPGQLEKQLENFEKLSQIIDQKGLQDIKTVEITNELERLNGVSEIFDFTHETLSFEEIERELKRLSNLVKVINPNQPQSFNLEEVGKKLKKYIASQNFIATKQTPISDGNGPEKDEHLNTVEQIQNDSPSTVIKENLQKEMIKEIKQPELEKSFLETLVKHVQSESAEIGGLIEPVMSENLDYTKFEDIKPVNYQGDDPSVYKLADVDTNEILNQSGDLKKNIEKFQELVKTIDNDIKKYYSGDVKNELPEEMLKFIDVSKVELLNPVELEKRIEMLYNFAESLKNRSSSAEYGKLEKEAHRANNNKNKKSVINRPANSEDGQNKKKSLKLTKTINKSEDIRIKRPSKSQKSVQYIKKSNKGGSIKELFDKINSDQSKKSKNSNKQIQSIPNMPAKNDLKDGKTEESDQPYGDDPNVYNSAETRFKLVENNAEVTFNKNEQFQSSKLESVFHNPNKLLSARNHEDYVEKTVVGKSQDDKSKGFSEKNELHSPNDNDYHKNIRKVEVGELKFNITLHFTFSRSL